MEEIPSKIKKIIEKAKKDKEVLAVLLFGSATRNQHYRDIDLCLILGKKYTKNRMSEKHIIYAGIAPEKVDISIFQQLPLYIRIRVLKEGKILFCKNEDLLYEFAFQTMKAFGDYKKLYEMYLQKVEHG